MASKRDFEQAYRKAKKIKHKGLRNTFITLIVIVAVATFFFPVINEYLVDIFPDEVITTTVAEGTAEVHFIDVGQGLSILVKGKDKNILYDAGEAEAAPVIVKYLKSQNVDTIDYFFASHPHSDHIGGCRGVMKEIETKNFIMCDLKKSMVPTTVTYKKLLQMLNDNKDITTSHIAKVGDTYDLGGGLVAEVIGPIKLYDDLNESSIVLEVRFGDVSFLLTGDMEKGSEKDMAQAGVLHPVTVLSAGHHGSSTSINRDFMEKIDPEYSVISCGLDNKYGHPHKETIELYNKMGIKYYRTDKQGTIKAVTDGKTVTFTTEK